LITAELESKEPSMTWRSAAELQDRQAHVRALLVTVLAGVSDEVAAHRPAPGSRAIAEVVAHLILTERRVAEDIRLMLDREHPELPDIALLDEAGRLQMLLAEVAGLDSLLATFDAVCQQTVAFVHGLTEAEESRSGWSADIGYVRAGCHATINARYHYPAHIAELQTIRRCLGLPERDVIAASPRPSLLG
jgi:hypothetical protein